MSSQSEQNGLRAVANNYRGRAGEVYHALKHDLPDCAYMWASQLRARKFERYVTRTSSVLEYGVGPGWNLAALQCREKVGYDIADLSAYHLEKYGITAVGSLYGLSPNRFDVVICHHTLEHLADPSAALEHIRLFLKPDGRLVCVVPYEVGRRYRRYDQSDSNHHLYSWNAQTAGNLIASAGFRIESIRIRVTGYDRYAAKVASRLRIGAHGYQFLLLALRTMRPDFEIEVVASRA